MILDTFELGPTLNTLAPDFVLRDHEHKPQHLRDLCGSRGVMLGFIGDIWLPTSVRRIFWLQRHAPQFTMRGAPVALLVRDKPHILYGFRMSNPLPVPFPLLADADGMIHRQFNMERNPGLVLLDRDFRIQAKWLMPDERIWPRMPDLIKIIEEMPR